VLGEEVTWRNLVVPGFFSMTEILAPTLAEFAAPELAREEIPKLLSGEAMWCQGFSEPGTGSDLSSLSCRATERDGHWVVNGQKLWTSLSQYSSRCVLLTRTGSPESRHRGITAFFVDMDTPGITVRPFSTMSGAPEFAEVFFDDVVVPGDRILGDVNGGWAVAMNILPFERSTSFWHRTAFLGTRLQRLLERAPDDVHSATVLGEVFQQLYAMRARSRLTQYRLAEHGTIGPETSVDKILVATAEQQLFDAARELLPGVVELDDSPDGEVWRSDFLYSRAATIYGGSAEIQRNIVARRLLDLGAEA
jgi:alkylation response protein AidB-like acyl-CoA dehydrogenase